MSYHSELHAKLQPQLEILGELAEAENTIKILLAALERIARADDYPEYAMEIAQKALDEVKGET